MLNGNLTFPDSTLFKVGQDENGNYGVILPVGEDGADTVVPFDKGNNIVKTLFYKGKFENQDICPITIFNGSISGDDIICNGYTCGIYSSGIKNATFVIVGFSDTSTALQIGNGSSDLSLPSVITTGEKRGDMASVTGMGTVGLGILFMTMIRTTDTNPGWFSGVTAQRNSYNIKYIGLLTN